MYKRFLSLLIVVTLVWISPGLIVVTLSLLDTDQSLSHNHADGAPCHDADEEGPCESGCPCLCCPGHTVLLFRPSDISIESSMLTSLHNFGSLESKHPVGITSRIFRPPQV